MVEQKRFALKRSTLIIAAGLLVLLLYLYFFVPFDEIAETVHRVNTFYFLLAFVALFMSTTFYSLTWQRLLNLLSVKASFLNAFQYCWVENFVNLVIPGEPIDGDVSRIYLMSKKSDENSGKVVAQTYLF